MEIVFLRQAHKFIKNSDTQLKVKLREEILKIQKNPYKNSQLSGKLNDMFSHHFSFKSVQYRIAYKIINSIIVIAIGSRENFYRNL